MPYRRYSATLLAPLVASLVAVAAAAGQTGDDEGVLRLIETIRASASAVTIDGSDGEWSGVPSIPDDLGDAEGDGRRDISQVSLIPTEEAVLVRIATLATPSRDDRAFWLNVDLAGFRHPELQFGFSPDGEHFVRRFDEAGSALGLRRVPFAVALDDVVEVALPFDLLEALLPDDAPLRGEGSRSWIRVTALTWDRNTDRILDYASAASYRIVPDPGPLDPPLPRRPEGPAATVDFPLEGVWWVSQGPFGYSTHAGVWAYDLSRTGRGLAWAHPRESCRNSDYHSWNAVVTAPAAGRVIRAENGHPDRDPCGPDGEGGGNQLYLDVGGDVGLWMAHLREGSVQVRPDDRVEAGQVVARVGNSGRTSSSHLHIGLYRRSDGQTTLPLAFRNVRVGLNPVDADPWARTMEVWEPRGGFFVQRATQR